MNVRLEKQFEFLATAYIDDSVFANKYHVNVELITNTMDGAEQNTALDRMRHMLYNQFSNALFVDEDDTDSIEKFLGAGLKVVAVPGPPVDQMLGIMLFCKLNAVAEERLFVTQLKIASDLGDNLYYCQDGEEDVGPFEYTGWWNESSSSIENSDHSTKKGNVIELGRKNTDWHSVGLDWEQSGDNTSIEFVGE